MNSTNSTNRFNLELPDPALENSANQRVYEESVAILGLPAMQRQLEEVGCSHRYHDRPRFWVIHGTTYYASFEDFIQDGR